MPRRRYIWSRKHGKYIDTHKRQAMRLLAKIAGEGYPIQVSGKYPPSFHNNHITWQDYMKVQNYKWFLSGAFVAYRYY